MLHDVADWNRLDAAAFRVSVKRSVSRLGWLATVVGALVTGLGFAGAVAPLEASGLVLTAAGLVQIAWGICRFAIYPMAQYDDARAIEQLEGIVQDLSRRNARTDPTVVEFRSGRFPHHRNRLGLYADGAVALLEHEVVRLERRTEIWIEAHGTTPHGRSINVEVQIGDVKLAGDMPKEHFERFEFWKVEVSRTLAIAA